MVKNIYTYLVLFSTLMMVIGGTVGIFSGISNYLFPAPYFETVDVYEDRMLEISPDMEFSEVERRYDSTLSNYLSQEKERAKNLIFVSFGWVLIPLPVFLYYQVSLRRKTSDNLDT